MIGELLPMQGVIIHSRSDWPCGYCRPALWGGSCTTLLCVECALAITAASVRKLEREGFDALDDLNGLVGQGCEAEGPSLQPAWPPHRFRGPKAR